MQSDEQLGDDLPQRALLRVREAEHRVSRQLEAIKKLERIGQATMACDARKLLKAWVQQLHTARRNLELARVARRTVGSHRPL